MKKMLLALMFVVLSITGVYAQPDSTLKLFSAVDDGYGKLSVVEQVAWQSPVSYRDVVYSNDISTATRKQIFEYLSTIWGNSYYLNNYTLFGKGNLKRFCYVGWDGGVNYLMYIYNSGSMQFPNYPVGFSMSTNDNNWICSERNKNYFVVMRNNGLFFSNDGGGSFNTDDTLRKMVPLQFNPWNDAILWVTKGSQLFATTDTGLTTSLVNTPITITKNTRLVFDKDQSTIYLTDNGVVGSNIYKSTNSGLTWDTVPQTMGGVITTGWQPGMLVKLSNGAIYTSYNHGATFTKDTTIPVTGWQTLTSTPLHDTVILVRNAIVYTYSARGLSIVALPVSVNERAKENNALMLNQNYPNPATTTTTISYELPEQSKVTLKLYNLLGEEVKTILDCSQQPQGKYQEEVNVAKLPNGVYIYVLEVNGKRESKKMLIVK